MFRYMHHLNNLPDFFKNYFVTNNQIHEHNTRNASKLHKCYKRTNYVKHTLSNKGVDVWNSLETKLNEVNSLTTSKSKLNIFCYTQLGLPIYKTYFSNVHNKMHLQHL